MIFFDLFVQHSFTDIHNVSKSALKFVIYKKSIISCLSYAAYRLISDPLTTTGC